MKADRLASALFAHRALKQGGGLSAGEAVAAELLTRFHYALTYGIE